MFTTTHSKIIAGVGLILVIAIGVYFYMQRTDELVLDETGKMVAETPLEASGEVIAYTFSCPDGKTFSTSYDLGSNALTLLLEGDMAYVLPQAVSASGARYATADESVVFWEHQGEAKVEMNGAVLHEGCVVQKAATSS